MPPLDDFLSTVVPGGPAPLAPEASSNDDPLAALHAIVEAARAPAMAAPPRSPRRPGAGAGAGLLDAAPTKGFDWASLINLVAPLIGSIGAGDHGAFMGGYAQGQSIAQQERAAKAQEAERRKELGSKYLLDVGTKAISLDDPVLFDQFKRIAEEAGVRAGYLQPGDLGSLQFPKSKIAEKRLKELTDQLDGLEKAGYNLDQLAGSGSHLKLKDGTEVPVSMALDLARKRPIDASGQAVARPNKADTAAATDFGRYLAKYAKGLGKTVDQLTAAEEMKAKHDYQDAGHDPKLDEINLNLAQLRLDNERRKATEAGSTYEVKPGTKEYRVAQDLAYGKLTMAQFRSLMPSIKTDQNKKLAIYDKAGELNPNFSPASFEMGFRLASNPKTQQQLASMDNVLTAVPDLLAASDEAKRTGTGLNSLVIKGGMVIGDQRYSNFHTAQIAFADELSGALGFGSATDMSRQMGINLTDPDLSADQFRSAVQTVIVPFIKRKRDTLLKQMGPYGQSGMNPAAPANEPPPGGRGGAPSYQDYLKTRGPG